MTIDESRNDDGTPEPLVISLRDMVAMKVLPSILADASPDMTMEEECIVCYLWADAFLKARDSSRHGYVREPKQEKVDGGFVLPPSERVPLGANQAYMPSDMKPRKTGI